jgi:hypothetical protein
MGQHADLLQFPRKNLRDEVGSGREGQSDAGRFSPASWWPVAEKTLVAQVDEPTSQNRDVVHPFQLRY